MKGDTFEEFKEQVTQALVDNGLASEQIDLLTPPKREFGELS